MKNIKREVQDLAESIKKLLLLNASEGIKELDSFLDVVIMLSYSEGKKDTLEELLSKSPKKSK